MSQPHLSYLTSDSPANQRQDLLGFTNSITILSPEMQSHLSNHNLGLFVFGARQNLAVPAAISSFLLSSFSYVGHPLLKQDIPYTQELNSRFVQRVYGRDGEKQQGHKVGQLQKLVGDKNNSI